MPLDKAGLKAAIEAAFFFEADKIDHPEDSRSRIAQTLANAIEAFVKSGDGIYQGGLTAASTPVTSVGVAVPIKIL